MISLSLSNLIELVIELTYPRTSIRPKSIPDPHQKTQQTKQQTEHAYETGRNGTLAGQQQTYDFDSSRVTIILTLDCFRTKKIVTVFNPFNQNLFNAGFNVLAIKVCDSEVWGEVCNIIVIL